MGAFSRNCVKSFRRKSVSIQARKCWILNWVVTDKSVGRLSQDDSIETMCKGIQDEEARQNPTCITSFSVILCNATTGSCESAGLNHDVRGVI